MSVVESKSLMQRLEQTFCNKTDYQRSMQIQNLFFWPVYCKIRFKFSNNTC